MTSLDERVTALEAVVLDPAGDLDALVSRLQERQELLDRVQAADVEALPEPERSHLRERLRTLLGQTERAMQALAKRRDELVQQQQNVVTARTAARGYKPDMQGEKRSLTRRA